jgi:hypothetical protein
MKLLRYGPPGQEKPGLLDRDGKIRDLSGAVRYLDGDARCSPGCSTCAGSDPAEPATRSGITRLGPLALAGSEGRRDRPQLTAARRGAGAWRSRRSRSSSKGVSGRFAARMMT